MFCAADSIRTYRLEHKGARKRTMLAEDVREINELWLTQFVRRAERIVPKGNKSRGIGYEVDVRLPSAYDELFREELEEAACRS